MNYLEFDPHIDPERTHLILVGCGGTGSAISLHIGRILQHLRKQRKGMPHRISFVDHDIVEEKNIGRQNFLESHIGEYKAEVLARRLNLGYGLAIEAIPEAFSNSLFDKMSNHGHTIILGAVDNHEARNEISM